MSIATGVSRRGFISFCAGLTGAAVFNALSGPSTEEAQLTKPETPTTKVEQETQPNIVPPSMGDLSQAKRNEFAASVLLGGSVAAPAFNILSKKITTSCDESISSVEDQHPKNQTQTVSDKKLEQAINAMAMTRASFLGRVGGSLLLGLTTGPWIAKLCNEGEKAEKNFINEAKATKTSVSKVAIKASKAQGQINGSLKWGGAVGLPWFIGKAALENSNSASLSIIKAVRDNLRDKVASKFVPVNVFSFGLNMHDYLPDSLRQHGSVVHIKVDNKEGNLAKHYYARFISRKPDDVEKWYGPGLYRIDHADAYPTDYSKKETTQNKPCITIELQS